MNEEDKLNKMLRFREEVVQTNKAALWDRIQESTQKEDKVVPIRRKVRPLYYWAAAASVAVLLAFVFLMQNNSTNVSTPFAQTETHELPDASLVQLNAGSEIVYDAKKWSKQRILELEGEAFFDVEKGSSFTVNTSLGKVEVLGTEFNVFAREGIFVVECTEGRVAVTSKSGNQQEITVGEKVSLLADGNLQKETGVVEEVKWLNGQFEYRDQTVGHVLDELERQFDVEIRLDEARRAEGITLSFSKAEGLAMALEKIKFELRLASSQNGRIIQLSNEN